MASMTRYRVVEAFFVAVHLHERKRARAAHSVLFQLLGENLLGATVCDRCGTPLSETEPIFYDQKLMRALHHPVPETREMSAMLLGQRQDRHSVPLLMARLLEETDIGVLCAICLALGQLGDCQAVT